MCVLCECQNSAGTSTLKHTQHAHLTVKNDVWKIFQIGGVGDVQAAADDEQQRLIDITAVTIVVLFTQKEQRKKGMK